MKKVYTGVWTAEHVINVSGSARFAHIGGSGSLYIFPIPIAKSDWAKVPRVSSEIEEGLCKKIKGVRHTLVFLSISLNCVYGIECIKYSLDNSHIPWKEARIIVCCSKGGKALEKNASDPTKICHRQLKDVDIVPQYYTFHKNFQDGTITNLLLAVH